MDQRLMAALQRWVLVWVLACGVPGLCFGAGATDAVSPADEVRELEERAARLLKVVASLAKEQAPAEAPPAVGAGEVRVSLESTSAADPRNPARLGWFDAESRTLHVEPGLPASRDDALFELVSAELRGAMGNPAEPWFARGIAYVLMNSCAGFSLTEIESRTQPVTLDDVLGRGGRRSRVALAPAEARMARSLLVAQGVDVAGAWRLKVRGSAQREASLRASWEASLDRSPAGAALAYPRSVSEGAYVRMERAGDGVPLGDLKRLASLGFAGVEFPFAVTSGPSAEAVATSLVRASVAAKEASLSVIWSPRWEWSKAESPVPLAQRQAHAVEALSWVAEQARVDGIVLFASSDLLQPNVADTSSVLRDARRQSRRLTLESSRPFAGDRLAFADDKATAESARSEDFTPEFTGALAVIRLKVGIGNEMSRPALRRLGPWQTTDSKGLKSLTDQELKALAGR